MIGIVVRFDLKDSEAASVFDILTQEVLVGIAENEPGTHVYATQSLLAEPLARIFYEVYADENALQAHEAAPHVIAFHAKKEALLKVEPRVELFSPGPAKGLPSA
jgi:quinol monooxygenase YgiN